MFRAAPMTGGDGSYLDGGEHAGTEATPAPFTAWTQDVYSTPGRMATEETAEAVPLRWFGRAAYRAVPIDASVIADEQRSIDLYVRAGLIPKARAPRAEAILDTSVSQTAAAVQ